MLPPFPSPDRNAFNGLCLVIIRANPDEPGEIRLIATGDELEMGSALITTTAPVSATARVTR